MNTRRMLHVIALTGACLVSLLIAGCSGEEESTVCDQAIEKWKSCDAKVTVQGGDVNCSGQTECVSRCAVQATCGEIQQDDPNSAYAECEAACGQ
jgi:hypothetical protein